MGNISLKAATAVILSFVAASFVACVPTSVNADTFEAGMQIVNENSEVGYDGSLNFTVTSNHNEFSIQSLTVSDKDTYQSIYAGGSEYRLGTLVTAQETLDKDGYRYSFELRNVRFDTTHSGILGIKLYDGVTGTEKELSARYYSLFAFSATLSCEKISYVGEEPLVFKIHSNHDAFSIASAELSFTDKNGKTVSLEDPALKKGTMYSKANGKMDTNGDVTVSLGCLKNLTEDGTVSMSLSVYNEEEDETVNLSDIDPDTGKAVPYQFSYLKNFSASFSLLGNPEDAKPFEFVVKSNRPFKLEEFTIKNNNGTLDFMETKPAQDGAVLNYGTQDSKKFGVGTDTFVPDSKGELRITVPAELVAIGEGMDHDGRVFMKLWNEETGQSVELTQGYHAKGFQPVDPTSVNVLVNGLPLDKGGILYLNEGQETVLEVSLVPADARWDFVEISLAGEGVKGEYADSEDGKTRYYTLKGTENPCESVFNVKVTKTNYNASYKLFTRYRTALVVDVLCVDSEELEDSSQRYNNDPDSRIIWNGIPDNMSFGLYTWKGEDVISSVADKSVSPDLGTLSFVKFNMDMGNVNATFRMETVPVNVTGMYFYYHGAVLSKVKNATTGRFYYEPSMFEYYNTRKSASSSIRQTFSFRTNGEVSYNRSSDGRIDTTIFGWLSNYADHMLQYKRMYYEEPTEVRVLHKTDWKDIKLIPEEMEYDNKVEVRYVIYRYQLVHDGAYLFNPCPYWMNSGSCTQPAVVSWQSKND